MASLRKIAPFGTWTSPITSSIPAAGVVLFAGLMVDPKTKDVYIIENRPAENGRGAIVRFNAEGSQEALPQKFNVRSKVHTYGGGAAAVRPDGCIVFTDVNTTGVYLLSNTGEVEEIIAGSVSTKIYYADFSPSPTQPELILAIQELHRGNGEVVNTIALLNTKTKTSKVVVEGADFYFHPRFSPDGKNISWTQWNHPDMPWTGAQVFVADWVNGVPTNKTHLAGKPLKSAVCQPRWSPDGSLWFVDEPNGIWQLFRYDLTSKSVEYIHLKGYEEVEMGKIEWYAGTSTYDFLDENTLVIAYTNKGATGIIIYDIITKSVTELPLDIVHVDFNSIRSVSPTTFAVIGGTTQTPPALYLVDITRPSEKQILKSSTTIDLPLEIFSPSQSITFPRTHGTDLSRPSYAIFVPPHNPGFEAPSGSLPPLIINMHGGPTGHVPPALRLDAQYFTSRGYAFAHVNYAGSSGFGRAYRDDLDYSWGIKDVEDTVSCIDFLASQNLIDKKRVAIRGASSGGYTVLQALVSYPQVFAAGCSYFGVGNLKKLMEFTHKFESHYIFNLLFPPDTSDEEKEEIYRGRSPCFHAEKITAPVVLLQGSEDPVVPLQQALEMERVMKDGGKDVTLIIFEGEGHGFRKEENVRKCFEDEEALYKRTLIT